MNKNNITAAEERKAPVPELIPTPDPAIFGKEKNPISGVARQEADGTFRTALGHVATAEHRNVAKVWQDNCKPLLAEVEQIEAQHQDKRDVYVKMTDLKITPELRLEIPSSMIDHSFTPYGLYSMITKYAKPLGVGVMDYLTGSGDEVRYSPTVLAEMKRMLSTQVNLELDINRSIWAAEHPKKRLENQEVLLRLRKENGWEVVRMVASDRYGIIDHQDVLRMLMDAMPSEHVVDALVSHWSNDGDNLHGTILLPDQMKDFPDSQYGVGIAVANSEVGKDILKIMPFLFRSICENGCVWGRRDSSIEINRKHLMNKDKGIDWASLRNETKRVVQVALAHGDKLMTQANYAREAKVAAEDIAPAIAYLSREFGLSIEQARAWYAGFTVEPYDSAYGIWNGLTRGAQEFTGDKRWAMETMAGDILTPSLDASQDSVIQKWNKTVEYAKSKISDATAEKYTRTLVTV